MDGATWRPWTLSLTTAPWMLTSWPGPCPICWTCPSLAWWPPSWRTARRPWPPLTPSARPPSPPRPPEAARTSVTRSTRTASQTAGPASSAAGEIWDWQERLHLSFCLRSDCGGFKCLKTWDSDKPRKCQVADQFMQCVYQRIDIQVIICSDMIIYSNWKFARFVPLTDEDQPKCRVKLWY